MGSVEPMNTYDRIRLVDQMMTNVGNGYWQNKKYWPYQIEINNWYDIRDAERFCYTNFKSREWRNITRYFAFKRKEDYEWFVLRWS